jgi:UDP:flavonoid glycosyltransferase YjiC (YdhE family)
VRVLVAAMPFAGHVLPMTAVAAELVRRGHEVVAHTGARYGSRFEAAGAGWLPWRHAPDFDETDLRATFPQVGDGRGPRAVTANLEHVFLRTAAGQAEDILSAGPFDVLVSDNLALGAALAAARTGTPWATVALVPLGLPSRDLPPFGLALLPGRGPLGRVRDAALRSALAATLRRRLDRVMAEVCGSVELPARPALSVGY